MDVTYRSDSNLRLMSQFESLGDNCEFGFVQRFCGHEEGGLFRWSRIKNVEHLIGALQCRFDGMFEYDTMRPCDFGMIEDARHPVQWHTARATEKLANGDFTCNLSEQQQRVIFDEERDKYSYLKQNFLTRCSLASKIFVFKMNAGIEDVQEQKLFAALRAIGPVTLLVVRVADQRHAACSVRRIQPGLYEGRISSFALYREANRPQTEEWLRLCHSLLERRSRDQSGFRPLTPRGVIQAVKAFSAGVLHRRTVASRRPTDRASTNHEQSMNPAVFYP